MSSLRGANGRINTRRRAITIEAEPQWENERVMREVHQGETATVKGRCLIPAMPGQQGFCQDGMHIKGRAVQEHFSERLRN